jgi:adenylate cyclase
MEPEELLALLNDYLTVMTELVMEEEGTLDKYIGDAIMAFWNAPRRQEDHADRALRCAVLMQREMRELNRAWMQEGRKTEPFQVRIGVNTGDVVVGNVGGEERFDYSAIGDPVNLAARLEPANKTYGTLTMASEFTIRDVDASAYRLRELDLIAVKGKSEPVTVYEVLELADHPLDPALEEALGHYESGMRAYRDRDWELAGEYFAAALETRPEDGPSQIYVGRSRNYRADPPPTDWDCVVRRKVK